MNDKIKNTEYFELQIGGFFLGFTRIRLEKTNEEFFLGYYPGFQNPEDAKKVRITEIEYESVLSQIYTYIWNWKEEYNDEDVDDGIQWTIRVKLKGEDERVWYGCNLYPDSKEWNAFIETINSLPIPTLEFDI